MAASLAAAAVGTAALARELDIVTTSKTHITSVLLVLMLIAAGVAVIKLASAAHIIINRIAATITDASTADPGATSLPRKRAALQMQSRAP